MDYAASYMNATKLAELIQQSATQGDTKKAGGLMARGEKRRANIEEDFEETRAKYMNLVRNMFQTSAPTEEDFVEVEDYLAGTGEAPKAEGVKPQRNPKNFASDIAKGNLSERDLLALTLQAEAGGEGVEGMLATGAVIANRVNTKGYGDTFSDVILAPGQFSAWNSLTGYAGGEGGLDMSSLRASKEAYRVADQILSGEYESPVGGATHYYNPNVADPAWGKRGGGNWQTIGNHVFGYGN